MFHRIVKPTKSQSFFLFGARGTGKSTFINQSFLDEDTYFINLLEDSAFVRYSTRPDQLIGDLEIQSKKIVVIDEIQKVPKLLDVVHHLIETKKYRFVLTGSSARKIKKQSGNLLAGRAFNYQMFPFTHVELSEQFNLDDYLMWGGMPQIFSLNPEDREEYLRSYSQVYLREEILQEQIVRNGIAFRQFLEIAANSNGQHLNYSKIARDLAVDTKTIQSYFQILEDTLVGYFLPAFSRSVRKSVGQQAKFYLFDLGVKRALEGTLRQRLVPMTSAYGRAFEHFIITETIRLNSYYRADFNLYQYYTTAGGEIDLILSRGREVFAVEIKSTDRIDLSDVSKIKQIASALKLKSIYIVSRDPNKQVVDNVICLGWRDFFKEIFTL